MKSKRDYFFENFWCYTTNMWTLLCIGVALADFFTHGGDHYLLTPFAIIYGALLSIFVGTKEFDRWFEQHRGNRHPGEFFVALWSIAFVGMAILSVWLGDSYKISSDVISVYIMVLTVFAITQSSKRIHSKHRSKRHG